MISQFNRETDLLAFKGGILNGDALEVEQIQAIARLPTRDVLYQQFVGVVASPITGVRLRLARNFRASSI